MKGEVTSVGAQHGGPHGEAKHGDETKHTRTKHGEEAKHGMMPDGKCICWGLGKYPTQQSESNCVIMRIYNSLKRMERGMDRQLKYLDTLTPTQVHEKMKS